MSVETGVARRLPFACGGGEAFDAGFIREAFDSAPCAMVLVDEHWRVRRANSEFERLFGHSMPEVQGMLLEEFLVPQSCLSESVAINQRVVAGEVVSLDSVRLHRNGMMVPVSISVSAMAAGGACCVYRDVSDSREVRAMARRISDRRIRLFTENILDLVVVLTADLTVRYVSPSIEALLGQVPGDQMGREFAELVHPDDRAAVRVCLEDIRTLPGPHPHFEFRSAAAAGGTSILEAIANNQLDDDGVSGIVITMRDITARRQAEEALFHQAYTDGLTGLPNRRMFVDRLERCLSRFRRHPGDTLAVLFIDLDRFKNVNDSLGHAVGDELLAGISKRLLSWLRPEDTVSRMGGDEFAVLLEDINGTEDAIRVAARIAESLVEPFKLTRGEVFTSASIGIAIAAPRYHRGEELLRDADTAMYCAKARGPGHYQVFDRSMHASAVSRLSIETDLRRALERGELRLAYQPILRAGSLCLVGFEALLRWDRPGHGVISPSQFIPVTEETGLIVPFGEWVLMEACQEARRWLQASGEGRDLTVSVNISARQFERPDFTMVVERTLSETGLRAACLHLEITESILMARPDESAETLQDLRGLGVQVQVDDFGTGYSSLGYLHRFQVDMLKIDRSFVSTLGTTNPRDAKIVRSIINLGKDLGVGVVAEGVESALQLEVLEAMGCDYVQGHLFSEAIPGGDVLAML